MNTTTTTTTTMNTTTWTATGKTTKPYTPLTPHEMALRTGLEEAVCDAAYANANSRQWCAMCAFLHEGTRSVAAIANMVAWLGSLTERPRWDVERVTARGNRSY